MENTSVSEEELNLLLCDWLNGKIKDNYGYKYYIVQDIKSRSCLIYSKELRYPYENEQETIFTESSNSLGTVLYYMAEEEKNKFLNSMLEFFKQSFFRVFFSSVEDKAYFCAKSLNLF